MATTLPPYFKNTLEPVDINKASLDNALAELRAAVKRGVDLIETDWPPPNETDQDAYGDIFNGSLGIALMYLRLEHQHKLPASRDDPSPDYRALANARINTHPMTLKLQPGRPSPLTSASVGAAVMRILAGSQPPRASAEIAQTHVDREDIAALERAVKSAIGQGLTVDRHDRAMGVDEVLYGRAGLLWALLNLGERTYDSKTKKALEESFADLKQLSLVMINMGRLGAESFQEEHPNGDAMPLMWPWINQYFGLGAVHGMSGILTVLLACDGLGIESEHIRLIGPTITKLSKICVANKGHLPSSVPEWPSSRASPLVQICHGTPGLLLLLACARSHPTVACGYWEPSWDQAIRLGSERIWEQGLLSKGGGLCHGIAGNAWPWLMLHDCFEYRTGLEEEFKDGFRQRTGLDVPDEGLSGDYFLSKALAFLLHAQTTAPFKEQLPEAEKRYRMPDHPYSLFEGLAGSVCAWAEACVVLAARLRKMEAEDASDGESSGDDEVFRALWQQRLGFPGLGGHGAKGLL